MSADKSALVSSDLNSNNRNLGDGDVTRGFCDVAENVIHNSHSFNCSHTESEEFEHEAADYQWLLDYDSPPRPPSTPRCRESFGRDWASGHVTGSVSRDGRKSVLRPRSPASNISYEALSKNIDANLAQIDMDDFRSEDIHQMFAWPQLPDDEQDEVEDEDQYYSMTGSAGRCQLHQQQLRQHQRQLLKQQQQKNQSRETNLESNATSDWVEDASNQPLISYQSPTKTSDNQHIADNNRDANEQTNSSQNLQEKCDADDLEEDLSGVSGDASFYRSGPLFSPLREAPQLPHSFSVDSLDSEEMHDDLILTCRANKNNYTIAFEGSYVQLSQDSDYQQENAATGGSGACPPGMAFSDEPYTTWSRVGRRAPLGGHKQADLKQANCLRGQSPSRLTQLSQETNQVVPQSANNTPQHSKSKEAKSTSMPNLMKRSLMRRSLEAAACNGSSGLSNGLSGAQGTVKVFDLQNSLRSSNHGAAARSVDATNFSLVRLFMKQRGVNSSSLSSSGTEDAGCCSSSDVPSSTVNDSSDWPMNSQSDMDNSGTHLRDINTPNSDERADNTTDTTCDTATIQTERILNNNNSFTIPLDNIGGNVTLTNITNVAQPLDNTLSFEDSLKDAIPCSKAPLTSPIREEPEGMDISLENKAQIQETHIELKVSSNSKSDIPVREKLALKSKDKSSTLPTTPKRDNSRRRRQSSGNSSSSGYASTEKLYGVQGVETEKVTDKCDRPRPKPRSLKQELKDQCLQTSNLKVSATVNTSGLGDQKEIYVYYPNYALPDLAFLKEKKYDVDARVFLVPQHYLPQAQKSFSKSGNKNMSRGSRRPFSCNDMERLRRHGISHVKDWESLNFLLPKELKDMLQDNTECIETMKPSFCRRQKEAEPMPDKAMSSKATLSKGASTGSQPSSGYQESSTMLADSTECNTTEGTTRNEDNEEPPPRPPLPRGILRKCTSLRESPKCADPSKRRSLQEPLRSAANKKINDTQCLQCSCLGEACTGFCSQGLRQKNLLLEEELPEVSVHEAMTEADVARLKSQVSRFLTTSPVAAPLEDCDCPRKSVSFGKENESNSWNQQQTPNQRSRETNKASNAKSPLLSTPLCGVYPSSKSEDGTPAVLYDSHDKRTLVLSVRSAVQKLTAHFNKGTSHQNKITLGSSAECPEVAQIALDKLCPAIYALLSDGLLPVLHSLFGKISNSVWRVVEATSQMGPSTKALNDLVMTLNSEECLSEGPMKYNAFIFGLLNIRSLDAWLSYLRTRESALQKHFHGEAFLSLSQTTLRPLYDALLAAVRPLALLPFRLDLLHEYKALHASLLRMERHLAMQPPPNTAGEIADGGAAKDSKELRNVAARQSGRRASPRRPRSCHESSGTTAPSGSSSASGCEGGDGGLIGGVLRKRWSGVGLGSRLATAMDRLLSDGPEESEFANLKSSNGSKTALPLKDNERSATDKDIGTEKGVRNKRSESGERESEGDRFRRLQLKWEAMTGPGSADEASQPSTDGNELGGDNLGVTSPSGNSNAPKSRIPRPVAGLTSPQSTTMRPFELALPSRKSNQPKPAPRRSLRDRVVPLDSVNRRRAGGNVAAFAMTPSASVVGPNRASSVPGRRVGTAANSGSRYEESSTKGAALSRRSVSHGRQKPQSEPRLVQTLHQRLASDSGHLSFSRGDILTLVVEVDDRFLLCCLHDRKGLVPRASVVPLN